MLFLHNLGVFTGFYNFWEVFGGSIGILEWLRLIREVLSYSLLNPASGGGQGATISDFQL